MGTSIFVYAPKIIFDFCIDVLYFLPWWYTRGLRLVGKRAWRNWRNWERELALGSWLRHFLRPLTPRADMAVRLGDIARRSFGIVWRGALLAVWSGGALVLLAAYIALPPVMLWQIAYQLLTFG